MACVLVAPVLVCVWTCWDLHGDEAAINGSTTLWHATQRLKVHYVLKSLCVSRPLDGIRDQLLIHDSHCLMQYLMDSDFANPKDKGNIIIIAASAQPVEGHCYTLPGWHYILPHADVLLLTGCSTTAVSTGKYC